MLFKLTIFGIIADIPIEIDYKADVILDVTSFELPKVSGFEIELPATLLPISFNNDEIEIEILNQKIERDTTVFNVNTTTGINVNDYFWLGNEVIQVNLIGTNIITVYRGMLGTIKNRYKRDDSAGIKLYLNKYPVWLTGKLLKIENAEYEIIQYATIDEEPEFEKGLVKFQCSDLTKSLDNDLPKMYLKQDGDAEVVFLQSMLLELMNVNTTDEFGSYDYIPEFFSFCDSVYAMFFGNNDILVTSTLINLTKITSYKDLIEICLKIGKSVLYQDKKTGYYELKSLSPTLSFQTNTEIKMLNCLDSSKDYKIKKQENIKKINVKYNDKKKIERKITFNITNVLFGKTLDIDLSAFQNINQNSIFSMASRYWYDTSFIYAVVEIPSSEIISKTFEIGQIYKFTDVLQYSFQNITDYCMFLGSDNDVIKFAMLKNYVRTLLSPALPMRRDAISTKKMYFGWLGDEFTTLKIDDFLNIPSAVILPTIENAVFKLNDTIISYFEVGDYVLLYDFFTDTLIRNKITAINDNEVDFEDAMNYPVNYWLLYDTYVYANDRQKNFFYLDINNY